MYDSIGKALNIIFFLALIGVTLGLWKLVEIMAWVFTHVHVTW
jgi:hypothetical protein